MGGRGRRLLAACLLLPGIPAVVRGQESGWIARSLPHADLWYAALAQLPFEESGSPALYDADFALRVRDAKRAAGITTRLDTERAALRAALARDSAFEVLHFVPLYFVGTDRAGMTAALRAVAAGRDAGGLADPRARFGATIVAAVLTTPAQRAVLARLVEAVEDEWQRFFGVWWSEGTAGRSRQEDSVQALWDGVLAHRLRPVLARAALDSGMILLSPALGADGRLFAGAPTNRADNVVAVRLPPGAAGATVAAVSVVREICYPVASALVADEGGAHRPGAQRASGRLAVRCGAMLLADAPEPVRDAFARAYAGARPIADVFPVDSVRLELLRRRLGDR